MKALTGTQIKTDIEQMRGNLGVRNSKYIRNYNRYVNNGTLKDQITNIDTNPPPGWIYNAAQADTGPIPILNVLRSMIETIVSKLAQTKVRPFFNPVQGTWATRKACRAALQFFDLYFDNQELFAKGNLVRRDSLVFEDGLFWVNEDKGSVEHIRPWDYLFDRAEYHYGEMTRCAVRRETFPLGALVDAPWLNAHWKGELDRNRIQKVTLTYYYDLLGQKLTYLINDEIIADRSIDHQISPVVMSYYSVPIKGAFSTSLIDNQLTLQTFVDLIAERIELATELSPANVTLLPRGANLKRSAWTNEIGAVYEYVVQPFVNSAPVILTPPPISPEYLELLKYAIDLMYNLEGVSQLSAQSVKPPGINSGVALQTLGDIESDRFQTLQDEHISMYQRVTNVVMEVLPQHQTVLPPEIGRARVKWSDVKRQRELFSVQFAPVSALSKDPQTKMQQVEKLGAMFRMPPGQLMKYLGFPDLENFETRFTCVEDVIEAVIEHAVETGDYRYDLIIPSDELEQAVMREIYRLRAADEKPDVINRARQLYLTVRANAQEMQSAENPPAPVQITQGGEPPQATNQAPGVPQMPPGQPGSPVAPPAGGPPSPPASAPQMAAQGA